MNKTEVILTSAGSNIPALVNKTLKKKVTIGKKESGAPYLVGSEKYFSLSHKEKLLCFALSPRPVGVDIEKIVEKDSVYGIAERYFGEKIELGDKESFFLAWTRKEALGKLLGKGLDSEILSTDLSLGEYDTEEGKVKFTSWFDEGYLVTVACYDDEPIFKKEFKKQQEKPQGQEKSPERVKETIEEKENGEKPINKRKRRKKTPVESKESDVSAAIKGEAEIPVESEASEEVVEDSN